MNYSRSDLSVLFWIVGSVHGATFDEIIAHESRRHRQPPAPEAIRASIERLEAGKLVILDEGHYRGEASLQKAFLNECRNCRDTIEEVEILRRLIDHSRAED